MMTLLVIAILIALVLVLVYRKAVPNYQVVAGGLAAAALLVALGRLTSGSGVHPDLKAPPVYERSVGHALGQAAAKAFPNGGELLVISEAGSVRVVE